MREYCVANGSRYPSTICYTDSDSEEQTSVDIDVGEVHMLPPSARKLCISLNLQDRTQRQILQKPTVNDGKERSTSTIITREGSIAYGHKKKDTNDRDWMWKSSDNGIDHKPRICFVANALGKDISVQYVNNNGRPSEDRPINIAHGETATLENRRVKITYKPCLGSEREIFRGTVELRTSLLVCSENRKMPTGKLYGENIEDKKWTVDGHNYKPGEPRSYRRMPRTWVDYLQLMSALFGSIVNIVQTFMSHSGESLSQAAPQGDLRDLALRSVH